MKKITIKGWAAHFDNIHYFKRSKRMPLFNPGKWRKATLILEADDGNK